MIVDVFRVLKESPYLKGATSFYGQDFLTQNDSPNRIVWVPTSDKLIEGGVQGRIPSSTDRSKPKLPRAFGRRECGVDVYLWGKAKDDDDVGADYLATEHLLNNFMASIHQALNGAFQFLGAEWQPDALAQTGVCVVLRLEIHVPMFKDLRVSGNKSAPWAGLGNAELDGGMVFVKTAAGQNWPDAPPGSFTVESENPSP